MHGHGVFAIFGALMGLIRENPIETGFCLIPAALAFGTVA